GLDPPDANGGIEAANALDRFDADPAHLEPLGKRRSGVGPWHELGEPRERKLHRPSPRELGEHAQGVLVEKTEGLHAEQALRDAIDAHPEREAAPGLRVVPRGAQHVRMDHSRAADLEPPAPLANAAIGLGTSGGTTEARDVDLRARLGERKEA